jgi:multicomponent Na+:H+ antiporter subunit E
MSTSARVLAVIWLTVVWCAVMESVSVGTIVAGVVVGAALTLLFPSPAGTLTGTRLRPWAFVVMNATLFAALVRANLLVAWAVIAPERAGLRRGIVAVPLVPSNGVVLNLLLNAVSLTPGTLILEVSREPLVLYIHLLQLRTEAAVHLEVLTMERTIVRALGPREALGPIDDRIAIVTAAAQAGDTVPPLVGASDPTDATSEEDDR